MNIITKANVNKAIQCNAELLGTSQGFQEAAKEIAAILTEDITAAEQFGLIDFADDANCKEGRRLVRNLAEAIDKPQSSNPLSALMGSELGADDVDFATQEGNAIARVEGKKKAYRKALSAMKEWTDGDKTSSKFELMVQSTQLAREVNKDWMEYYAEQEKKASVRLSELKAMSF